MCHLAAALVYRQDARPLWDPRPRLLPETILSLYSGRLELLDELLSVSKRSLEKPMEPSMTWSRVAVLVARGPLGALAGGVLVVVEGW